MPRVTGFLRIAKRGGGHPDQELPGIEGPVDPGWGVDEGGGEGIWPGLPDIGLPTPPPGIWPPLTPEHPWLPLPPSVWPRPPSGGRPDQGLPRPPGTPDQGLPPVPGAPDQGLPPGTGTPEHPIVLPPGTIWPPLPPGVHGKYLALVLIGGGGKGVMYRYVVVDADLRPDQGLPPYPSHPIAPGGGGGTPPAPDQGLPPTAQPKSTR